MRYAAIAFVAYSLLAMVACQRACNTIRQRKEIRDLSKAELDRLIRAFRAAHAKPPGGVSAYDKLAKVHGDWQENTHGR